MPIFDSCDLNVDQLSAVKPNRLALCAKPIDTHFSQHDTAHRHAATNATNKALFTSDQTCKGSSMLQMSLYLPTSPKMDTFKPLKLHHRLCRYPPRSSDPNPEDEAPRHHCGRAGLHRPTRRRGHRHVRKEAPGSPLRHRQVLHEPEHCERRAEQTGAEWRPVQVEGGQEVDQPPHQGRLQTRPVDPPGLLHVAVL